MATEIAILPLLEGINLDDSTSTGRQTFQDVLDAIRKQKGFQRLYWGQETGDSTNLRVFIDWNTVEDHVAFTKTEHFASFMETLGKVVDLSRARICHVNATPHPPLALSVHASPVTEILTVYFPSEYSDSDRKNFDQNMEEMFAGLREQEVYKGSARGWILEDVPIPNTDDTGKAWEAFIGWESLDAFKAFQQTAVFAKLLGLLKGAKDMRGITVDFYTGNQVDKDT